MHYVRKWNIVHISGISEANPRKILAHVHRDMHKNNLSSTVCTVLAKQQSKTKKNTIKISLGGKINCGMFIYQCGTFITSYLDEMNTSHAEVRIAKEYIPCITYVSQNTRKMKQCIYYLQLYTCCKPQRKWKGIHRRILAT